MIIFGDLQLLCTLFKRYVSNIKFHEQILDEMNFSYVNSLNFLSTTEENEQDDEELPIISPLLHNRTKFPSKESSRLIDSVRRQRSTSQLENLKSTDQKQSSGTIKSEYSSKNLQGKHYGSIEVSNITIIEVLEILLQADLDLIKNSKMTLPAVFKEVQLTVGRLKD